MLRRNMFMKHYNEASPEGGDGSGAPSEPIKTYTQAEVDEMTKGLKESRDTLLTEKKQASLAAKEAEAAKLLAEQENAKKSGELDKFEASLRGEFDKERGGLTTKLEALTNRVVGESKKAVLSSFSSDFIAPESIDLIGQLVKTEFDGENVKTQYTDFSGNVITTDAAEFKKWMSNHPAISHLMKADAASGGGATGGKTSGGAANFSTMSLTERSRLANENPKLYAQLSGQSK